MKTINPLKIGDYLIDRAVTLLFMLAALFICCAVAIAVGMKWTGVLLSAAVCLVLVTAVLTTDYVVKSRRLKRLERSCAMLKEKYLLGEVLPPPRGEVECRYFDTVRAVSHSAVTALERAESEKDAYCEYVESWIHELKTPLAASFLMLENGDVGKIKTQLKRMENLTECILYYARLKTAENDCRIERVDSRSIIAAAVGDAKEMLIEADISVSVEGDVKLVTDAKAVKFMLGQLLVNCAKYCPHCRVRISAENGRITVSDNGPGVAAHELPRLTERGFTGGGHSGTGMGLYIVSELCLRLGIDFSLSSVLGEGMSATFSFETVSKP